MRLAVPLLQNTQRHHWGGSCPGFLRGEWVLHDTRGFWKSFGEELWHQLPEMAGLSCFSAPTGSSSSRQVHILAEQSLAWLCSRDEVLPFPDGMPVTPPQNTIVKGSAGETGSPQGDFPELEDQSRHHTVPRMAQASSVPSLRQPLCWLTCVPVPKFMG
jgi:hypothetical protein